MNLTTKQKISRTKKLVSAAKSIVSGQVGLTVGSYTIANKLRWLGKEWEEKYPIFNKYCSSLPIEIPVGTERLEWNLDRIIELDPILAKIEYEYRSLLIKACIAIIQQYD